MAYEALKKARKLSKAEKERQEIEQWSKQDLEKQATKNK